MCEEELLINYSKQIKELADEISALKQQKKAALQFFMDIDSQIVRAIALLEESEK